MKLATGDWVEHEVYGRVQVSGFLTVSDQIEVNEVQREDEGTILDVSSSVQSDKVQFLDDTGSEHVEPLDYFYEHVN